MSTTESVFFSGAEWFTCNFLQTHHAHGSPVGSQSLALRTVYLRKKDVVLKIGESENYGSTNFLFVRSEIC